LWCFAVFVVFLVPCGALWCVVVRCSALQYFAVFVLFVGLCILYGLCGALFFWWVSEVVYVLCDLCVLPGLWGLCVVCGAFWFLSCAVFVLFAVFVGLCDALWCFVVFVVFLVFVGLCGPLWSFVVLCGALWCFVVLGGALLSLWCFVVLPVLCGASWCLWCFTGLVFVFCLLLVMLGDLLWSLHALCGPLWSFVVLCGPLWSFVVLCGPLWSFVVLCGPLWSLVVLAFRYRVGMEDNRNATWCQWYR
jgi:hypothetical protein